MSSEEKVGGREYDAFCGWNSSSLVAAHSSAEFSLLELSMWTMSRNHGYSYIHIHVSNMLSRYTGIILHPWQWDTGKYAAQGPNILSPEAPMMPPEARRAELEGPRQAYFLVA